MHLKKTGLHVRLIGMIYIVDCNNTKQYILSYLFNN